MSKIDFRELKANGLKISFHDHLDHELVALWIKELRSGVWEQGTGYLCSLTPTGEPDRLCCLGVFCQLIDNLFPAQLDIEMRGSIRYFDDVAEVLPESSRELLGANYAEVGLYFEDSTTNCRESTYLTTLNDGTYNMTLARMLGIKKRPLTFGEIADILEIFVIEAE